jgi:hypothetical protein
MSKRLYAVTVKNASRHGPGLTRLVEASSPAQARSHVAQLFFDVEIPTPLEAARLVGSGVPVEVAGEALPMTAPEPVEPPPAAGDNPIFATPRFMSPMAPPELPPELAERERQIREGPDVEAALAFRAAQREMAAIRPGMSGQLADRLMRDGVIDEEAGKRLAETGEIA